MKTRPDNTEITDIAQIVCMCDPDVFTLQDLELDILVEYYGLPGEAERPYMRYLLSGDAQEAAGWQNVTDQTLGTCTGLQIGVVVLGSSAQAGPKTLMFPFTLLELKKAYYELHDEAKFYDWRDNKPHYKLEVLPQTFCAVLVDDEEEQVELRPGTYYFDEDFEMCSEEPGGERYPMVPTVIPDEALHAVADNVPADMQPGVSYNVVYGDLSLVDAADWPYTPNWNDDIEWRGDTPWAVDEDDE